MYDEVVNILQQSWKSLPVTRFLNSFLLGNSLQIVRLSSLEILTGQHHVESLEKEDYVVLCLELFLHVDCKQGTSNLISSGVNTQVEPLFRRHYISEVGIIYIPQNIQFDSCFILNWDLHKCSKCNRRFFRRFWKIFRHYACKVHKLYKWMQHQIRG